jgi:hypothetical protein
MLRSVLTTRLFAVSFWFLAHLNSFRDIMSLFLPGWAPPTFGSRMRLVSGALFSRWPVPASQVCTDSIRVTGLPENRRYSPGRIQAQGETVRIKIIVSAKRI